MYCLINVDKLKKLEYGNSYKQKISVLEKRLRGINTTFRVKDKYEIECWTEGSISEGIQFFREKNIEDKHIYELLAKFIDYEYAYRE